MGPSLVVAPTATHTASFVFLHGLGDTGHGWYSTLRRALAPSFPFLKLVLPTAPTQKVSLNFGMAMPAWYDICSLDENDEREDEPGMLQSARTVMELVEDERRAGIPSERIFVGGFSQGGVVALLAGLTSSIPLAGIVALSAYAPLRKKLGSLIGTRHAMPAVFMGHGKADNVVQYRWGVDSAAALKGIGVPVKFIAYDNLMHDANERELRDVVAFIRSALDPSKAEL